MGLLDPGHTHLHVVAEGALDPVRSRLEQSLKAYLRAFNRRWGGAGVLRGPVAAVGIPGEEELSRAIRYVHGNPTRTRPPLAGIEPSSVPSASPQTLIAAAAAVYGVPPRELPGPSRHGDVVLARALFVRLGGLERYSLRQLAPFLNRGRQQISNLGREPALPGAALRIARTLLGYAPFQTGQNVQSGALSRATGP